jgi:hypothetical protein
MRGGVRLLEDFCILALGMASPILVFESTGRHYVDGPGGIERKGFFFFFLMLNSKHGQEFQFTPNMQMHENTTKLNFLKKEKLN